MLLKPFILSLTVVLSGVVFADSKIGDEVTGQLQIGKRSFALPPGNWTVIAEQETALSTQVGNKVSAQTKSQYLVQKDSAGKFVAAVNMITTLATAQSDTWNDTTCDRNDVIFKDKLDSTIKRPTCSLINHTANFGAGNEPQDVYLKTIYNWYKDNKLAMPYNTVLSRYVKFFTGDYVRVDYTFNPELTGLIDSNKKSWAQSPWHVDNIKSDSARLAYIEQVKSWNQILIKNSNATLMDGKPIDVSLPPIPGSKS